MDEHVIKHLEWLREIVIEWRKLSMHALGFKQTIKYKQITFRVSEHSVVADLSPLAYLDLVQRIEDGMVDTAVTSLYDRLLPLLECKHHWSPLIAVSNTDVYGLNFALSPGSHIHVCTECTGYGIDTFENRLPQFGIGTS